MKKLLAVLTTVLLMFSLTGCLSGLKLEEGQAHYTLSDKGEVTLEGIMSDNDAEDDLGIDFDDSKKDIEKDIIDQFDDMGVDVEIKKIKVGKDTLSLTMVIEDGEDMGMGADYTLSDYADDMYYEDIDALADSEDFVLYKNGKDIDGKDLGDYEDYNIINVSGSDEGCYYTVPGKIVALSDIDFQEKGNDTIFIEDGKYGIIIYK